MKSIDLIQIEDSIASILSRIEQERKNAKLLKLQLSAKVGVSNGFYTKTITRITNTSLLNVLKLLYVFGLTLKVERL